jgi:hypothetical protein
MHHNDNMLARRLEYFVKSCGLKRSNVTVRIEKPVTKAPLANSVSKRREEKGPRSDELAFIDFEDVHHDIVATVRALPTDRKGVT